MHHPTDRIAHTTAFVTPVVEHWLEREIAQWVHPMIDWKQIPDNMHINFANGMAYLHLRKQNFETKYHVYKF